MSKKLSMALATTLVLFSLTGCKPTPAPTKTPETPATITPAAVKMTEAEAKVIAEANCIKGGESLAPGFYNENSKTWWFDANLNATKPGCNPACVVSEETKTVEINWRCTGLLPEGSADSGVIETLRQLFSAKYPAYAETVFVRIDQVTPNHIRGSVIFEEGAPGGIFLAVKQDGDWQIVHDGNGQIPCALSSYGFPAEMLTDCTQP